MFENLIPVSDALLAQAQLFHSNCLGNTIRIHAAASGLPDLEGIDVVLIGIYENRGNPVLAHEPIDFTPIRKAFYQLFVGNWHTSIADLGDLPAGNTLEDTYFALREITTALVKSNTIPIYIGGSHDLTYPIYRAFDDLDQMVNVVTVDNCFDLGDSSRPLTNRNFVGKIITDQPYNLFNYSNLGYQGYYNAQEEIDLMDKLYFEAHRLGDIIADIKTVEPVVRDADIVSVDLNGLAAAGMGFMYPQNINGLEPRETCSLARYAGISDRVKIFGIFEYIQNQQFESAASLIAQMIWYFIEGVNFRVSESIHKDDKHILYYAVPVEDEVLHFYKSTRSQRWWIEIPSDLISNNKLKRHTLLPCTYKDYLDACNQDIPNRWFKAKQKNQF
ncbi:MAG: formimidoylglutamase [Leeuwenhoekiella sp.]